MRAGATLELEQTTFGAINVTVEGLTLEGNGFNDTGAIRNVAGNNSWAGTIAQAGPNTNLLTVLDGYPVINSGTTFYRVETGSSLNLSGVISNNVEMIKTGGGTLELSGIGNNTHDSTTRILEGTLLLNKEPGLNAVINLVEVGTDKAGALAATLKLGGSDQMRDDRGVRVHSSGLFDLNGNSEVLGTNFELIVGPNGAGDVNIGSGGTLTTNINTTVFTIGNGNPSGATITGGTLALQIFGVSAAAGTRTFQVNDGATGTDLTVTSAIVDGTGLQSLGIVKTGFGAMELGGTTANTLTGDTTVSEGTLLFNKGTGTGGVNAISGRLFIGDNNVTNGFSRSDVVRWLQDNQLPTFLAAVDLRANGWLDLNGHNETIGNVDAQNALTMRASSLVT